VRWFGRISYSLYLWQGIFLVPGWVQPEHWWQQFPYNIGATVAVATSSYYALERPLLRWGRRLALGVAQSADLIPVGTVQT